MKIALVHDYIKEYGGAERVLEALHELYPDAPIFTLLYCPEFLGPHQKRFANWDIRTSLLQSLPFKEKFISIYRLFAPFIFPLFNFAGYDIVIVSATGAYSPNMIKTRFKIQDSRFKKVKHICYCHTPPRYLYGYATARDLKKNPIIRIFAETANIWLKKVDIDSSKHVDQFIANSKEVAGRIEKFYKKDSVVVSPPVEIVTSLKSLVSSDQRPKTKDYYLAGGRLARPKHFDLIIKAAKELDIPLKIFGKGFAGYGEELRELAKGKNYSSSEQSESRSSKEDSSRLRSNNIEFLGEVTDEEKLELMKSAKAFLMASEDEDFGITPVEAMGVGTPVVAYKSGGLKETVLDGKTGVFFDELAVESLIGAIKRFEALQLRSGKKLSQDCMNQAQKFSKENFEKGIKTVLGI